MATTNEFYNHGIENAVDGLLSRLCNDYREGYSIGIPECKKVMRETYKFLSVLQLCIQKSKQTHSFREKYILYDTYKDFEVFTKSLEFQEVKELSKVGAINILTPHMISSIMWICEFCDTLLDDVAADDKKIQLKNLTN